MRRTVLRPGTRVGFIEPDFRSLLGRFAYLEAAGRSESVPLRVWASVMNQFYQANRLVVAASRSFGPATFAAVKKWASLGINVELLPAATLMSNRVRASSR